MQRNVADFQALQIVPRVLRDVKFVEPGTRVLGCELTFPLILSPTGLQTLFDPDGEVVAARAAVKAGIMYSLSSFGTETIEAVGDAGSGPRLFQLNALVDDALNIELIQRAKRAKFDALCLTVDNPTSSRVEEVERWGMSLTGLPPLRAAIEFAKRPRWVLKQRNLRERLVPYVVREMTRRGMDFGADLAHNKIAFRRDFTWEDAARLRKHWDGPFLLKGILSVEDAKLAVNMGATGLVVCNHGGLVLDGMPSSISMLRDIVDSVGEKIEIFSRQWRPQGNIHPEISGAWRPRRTIGAGISVWPGCRRRGRRLSCHRDTPRGVRDRSGGVGLYPTQPAHQGFYQILPRRGH